MRPPLDLTPHYSTYDELERFHEVLCRFVHGTAITQACRECALPIDVFNRLAKRDPRSLQRAVALRKDVMRVRSGK